MCPTLAITIIRYTNVLGRLGNIRLITVDACFGSTAQQQILSLFQNILKHL